VTILAGRYRLEELTSVGGFGDEWRCVDVHIAPHPMTAKLLVTQGPDPQRYFDHIRHWVRELARIVHRGVTMIYDDGIDPEAGPFVIFEYVEDSLDRLFARQGPFTPDRAMDVVAQLADALAAVHGHGLRHGELRPNTIGVRSSGTVVLKLFGLDFRAERLDFARAGIATFYYCAPEQFKAEPVTHQADIYSLGVVAYLCLTGRHPLQDHHSPYELAQDVIHLPPPPLPPTVPAALASIVERALAKDPSDRWPTAAAVAEAVRSIR
jgi:serine/threonine-protein kinase